MYCLSVIISVQGKTASFFFFFSNDHIDIRWFCLLPLSSFAGVHNLVLCYLWWYCMGIRSPFLINYFCFSTFFEPNISNNNNETIKTFEILVCYFSLQDSFPLKRCPKWSPNLPSFGYNSDPGISFMRLIVSPYRYLTVSYGSNAIYTNAIYTQIIGLHVVRESLRVRETNYNSFIYGLKIIRI